MIFRFKKIRLIFVFTLVALVAILIGQQVAAQDLAKAEITGISISTGDFGNVPKAASATTDDSSSTSSSSDSSASSNSSTTTTPNDTLDKFTTELKAGNTAALYNLMSAEFRDTFTEENFKTAWVESSEQIISVENLLTPQTLPAGWYEQQVLAKTQSGKTDKFNLVLHLENGVWVIYATELLT